MFPKCTCALLTSCQFERGGGGGVITFLPTVRSGYLRHVSEVCMCVVDALPAGFTGGGIRGSGCNNVLKEH